MSSQLLIDPLEPYNIESVLNSQTVSSKNVQGPSGGDSRKGSDAATTLYSSKAPSKTHKRSGSYGGAQPSTNFAAPPAANPEPTSSSSTLQPPPLLNRARSNIDNSDMKILPEEEANQAPPPPPPRLHVPPSPQRRLDSSPTSSRPINPDEYNLEENFNAFAVLEPRLQPLQPDTKDAESVEIFERHRRQALEYLKLKMEEQLLRTRKEELERRLNNPSETPLHGDGLDEWMRLTEQRSELHKLRRNICQQLSIISGKQSMRSRKDNDKLDDGWVIVDKSTYLN